MISCVIVDDEEDNRQLLRSLVGHLNEGFRIRGEASGVEDGFELINRVQPAVAFLDIRMQDGTAFQLLSRFKHISFEVVFVSGFDEYALKAFEYSALDYVLKPINVTKFGQTLLRVQKRITDNVNYFESLKAALSTYDALTLVITKIPVHHNGSVILLDLNEVMYVIAEDGCCLFYKSRYEKYLSAKQLSDFLFILDSLPGFVRISKGCYVNVNFIVSYSKGIDGTITLKDGTSFEMSRRKKTEVLEVLGRLADKFRLD